MLLFERRRLRRWWAGSRVLHLPDWLGLLRLRLARAIATLDEPRLLSGEHFVLVPPQPLLELLPLRHAEPRLLGLRIERPR